MSLGLRQSRIFTRRQRRWRHLKWVLILAFLVGLGVAGFQSGKTLSRQEVVQAREEIARLTRAIAALEGKNAALRAAAETSRMREAELKKRYAADVPRAELRALLAKIDEQLTEGASVDRLRFLISAASREEECAGEPVTKRFIVRTPLYDGANAVVTFAGDALTVTARGEPSEDPQGRVQAWFDPAKPVTLEVARLGEEPRALSGTLPLQHALVVNGDEYRLSVVPGERRGFIRITADRCRFP